MKVKKGDTVLILSGKDKGKKGAILTSLPGEMRVVVDGINMVKRHRRSRQKGSVGQIIEKPMPIHVSNVALIDAETGKPTRVGYKVEDGKKVRIAKKSGARIA